MQLLKRDKRYNYLKRKTTNDSLEWRYLNPDSNRIGPINTAGQEVRTFSSTLNVQIRSLYDCVSFTLPRAIELKNRITCRTTVVPRKWLSVLSDDDPWGFSESGWQGQKTFLKFVCRQWSVKLHWQVQIWMDTPTPWYFNVSTRIAKNEKIILAYPTLNAPFDVK